MSEIRKCKGCGAEFEKKKYNQKFHSASCQKKESDSKHRKNRHKKDYQISLLWVKKNTDKVRAAKARYLAKHYEEVRAKRRAFRKNNKEKLRIDSEKRRKDNPEKSKSIYAAYRKRKNADMLLAYVVKLQNLIQEKQSERTEPNTGTEPDAGKT